MPSVEVTGSTVSYEITGSGPPLLLIHALGSDSTCYGMQLPDYGGSFTCVAVDLPGAGDSSPLDGGYATTDLADHMAGLLDALGIDAAHVSGLSLGSAVAVHLAARHPQRVRSLTLNSTWAGPDPTMAVRLANWQALARLLPTVADVLVLGVFPWCFTADMYTARAAEMGEIEGFVRGRPAQRPEDFIGHAEAAIGHDARAVLAAVTAPTLITVGARDEVTPPRLAAEVHAGIPHSELVVFEGLGHAALNEGPAAFTAATLDFLARQAAAGS
ncbi:MAG: alpha/beta fold hydrolase [Microthrixaceae bacterium]